MTRITLSRLASLMAAASVSLAIQSAVAADTLTVKLDQPGIKMSPMLYGIMTEEINYSYDGGLYAELIRNRIFKESVGTGRGGGAATASGPAAPTPIPHWSAFTKGAARATIALDQTNPVNTLALTTALKLDIAAVGPGERAGVANGGFWGIPIKPSTTYRASFYARAGNGFAGPLTVTLESADGATVYATGTVEGVGGAWKKHALTLTTAANVTPTANARFVISGTSRGTVWFNLVSLFPPTYKDRPNGMRPDIMQLLADLKPTFNRFPGGNYVEGPNYENRWNWKATIGPLEDRPGHMGPWNYRSSDGVGLMEFLQWSEDLGAEPVVAVYAGLHIDGGRGTLTGDALKPHVQDALDEIEYITGPVTSKSGALRAQHGHPEPFKLTYMEIGNEDNLNNGGRTYNERYTLFHDAIRAKYPQIKLIITAPNSVVPKVDGGRNSLANKRIDNARYDVRDEHYYMNIGSALTTADRYDNSTNYPRGSEYVKVFIGEWATRDNRPTAAWNAGLSDSAFLTAVERNSDVVIMAGYAPLFVNVNPGGQQWATNLIGYDALTSFGGTSYYAQKLFYLNKGDTTIPYEVSGTDLWASCTKDTPAGEVILKIVSRRDEPTPIDITLHGVGSVEPNAAGWVLTGGINDVNTVAEPMKVAPKEIKISNAAQKFTHKVPAGSLTVLRLKAR